MTIRNERAARRHLLKLVQQTKRELHLQEPLSYQAAVGPVMKHLGISTVEDFPVSDAGAYFDKGPLPVIFINKVHGSEKRNFTFFHELTHHIIRHDDVLYAFLNEYADEDAFDATLEHYCNIGAAEFLIPSHQVSQVIQEKGFTIRLLEYFDETCHASRPAIAIQLAQSAPHNCRILVCEWGMRQPDSSRQRTLLSHRSNDGSFCLYVRYSTYSPANDGKYRVRPFTPIPESHLIYHAFQEQRYLRQRDTIPFHNKRRWNVDCEALFYKGQVFVALNHQAPPTGYQPALFELDEEIA
jgi:Zn-dependent peptidase ImmA (M78 family)